MRDRSVRFFFVLATTSAGISACILGACRATPPVSVVRTSAQAEKPEDVRGDRIKLKRSDQEVWSGARGGYYVIRNAEDWKGANDKATELPASLDPSSFMVFLAVAESPEISEVKIERAVETSEMLYVWAKETRFGKACHVSKTNDRPFDAVTTTRADKPVKFFVDEVNGEPCGDAPEAKVQCRKKPDPSWTGKLDAQPGDRVECELSATSRGKFELIDRVLSIDLPPGSTSKLAYTSGSVRGEFGVDIYGTYTVRGEAADEGGRHGMGSATVNVRPPKTKDVLVQLVWYGFERTDDPAKFPHVSLRVAAEGPSGQRCSADLPVPGLCDVKTRVPYTYMTIPASNRKLAISLQYQDERPEKGPGPCVHVWFDGDRTAEMCDREHRSQEDIWQLGTLDTTTGKIGIEPPSDAGASPYAVRDAGTTKPAPAKKPAAPPKK
jgi:hypothetical protein